MNASYLKYFLRQAIANIAGNRLIHLIGVGTIAIAFLIFHSFMLVFTNINHWTNEWGKSLTMSIYLKGDPDNEDIKAIKKELLNLSSVEIKRYISKGEAMRNIKKQLGDDAGLLDGLRENPFPASIEIVFSRDEGKGTLPGQLKKKLEKLDIVDEVQYSQELVRRITEITDGIKLIGIFLGGLLFFAILFIVVNTIKLTIYARKEEIEILRLVGATRRFIKIPFLIEGSIQGFLGGSLALMGLYVIYLIVIAKTGLRIGFSSLHVTFLSPDFIIFLLTIGVFIGFVGSAIALGRFFRV